MLNNHLRQILRYLNSTRYQVNDKHQKTRSLGNEQDFIAASLLAQPPQRQDHKDFVAVRFSFSILNHPLIYHVIFLEI